MVWWGVMLMDPSVANLNMKSKFLQNTEPRLYGVTSQKTRFAGTIASQALVQHINPVVKSSV
jgi:hypothetical protein